MENQEAPLSSSTKVCPYCESTNVEWFGTGRSSGVGEPMKEADRFTFQCKECDREFTYTGKMT